MDRKVKFKHSFGLQNLTAPTLIYDCVASADQVILKVNKFVSFAFSAPSFKLFSCSNFVVCGLFRLFSFPLHRDVRIGLDVTAEKPCHNSEVSYLSISIIIDHVGCD